MKRTTSSFLARVQFYMTAALVIAAVIQAIFFLDFVNLACTAFSLTSIISLRYFLRQKNVHIYTLSTGTGFMHAFGYLMLPLMFSCFEWRPLSRNLVHPVETFGWNAAVTLAIVAAHWYYVRSSGAKRSRRWIQGNVTKRLGLFREPSDLQLWVLGGFGMMAMIVVAVLFKSKGTVGEGGGAAVLTFQLMILAYVPFLIPYRNLFAPDSTSKSKPNYWWIGLYFLAILALAIYRNDRSDFANAIAIVAFCFAIGFILQRVRFGRKAARVVLWSSLFLAIAGPYLVDLAIAMVIVRHEYSKSGARGQIDLTLEIMQHREQIQAYLAAQVQTGDLTWDERYYDPETAFVGRFANPKIDDNFYDLASGLGTSQTDKFREFSRNQFVAKTLPGPLYNIFASGSGGKTDYTTASLGDYLFSLRYGKGLGGFRVGSTIGDGLILFGPWAVPIFGCLMIPFFVVVDSLTRRTKLGLIAIAPVALISIVQIVNPYVLAMFGGPINYIMRGVPQMIICYALFNYAARQVSQVLGIFGKGQEKSFQNPSSLPAPRSNPQA